MSNISEIVNRCLACESEEERFDFKDNWIELIEVISCLIQNNLINTEKATALKQRPQMADCQVLYGIHIHPLLTPMEVVLSAVQ